jgi:hypothetical protein
VPPTRRGRRSRFHVKTHRRRPRASRKARSRRPSTICACRADERAEPRAPTGDVHMVDVGAKPAVRRRAVARGRCGWRPRPPRR